MWVSVIDGNLADRPVYAYTDDYKAEHYRFRMCNNKYKYDKETKQVTKKPRWLSGFIAKKKIERILPLLKKGTHVLVHTDDYDIETYPKNAPPERQKTEGTLGKCTSMTAGNLGAAPQTTNQAPIQHQAVPRAVYQTPPPVQQSAPPAHHNQQGPEFDPPPSYYASEESLPF